MIERIVLELYRIKKKDFFNKKYSVSKKWH